MKAGFSACGNSFVDVISLVVLYNRGVLLKTDFFATKNLPSLGLPANMAGAPSHFTVIFTDERELPAIISLNDCRKFIAASTSDTKVDNLVF